MKNILIACECSQIITSLFYRLGYNVFSCDLKPTYGELPSRHIYGDVIPLLYGNCFFCTQDHEIHFVSSWDLIIAHPPYTDLAVSGARWFKEKISNGSQKRSIDFFLKFTNLECKHVCIENPISIMSTHYRKPDQIIQPWQFGHGESKSTCLWLKGLPKLIPTNIVSGREQRIWKMPPGPERQKLRSETYYGIASAMVSQWSNCI